MTENSESGPTVKRLGGFVKLTHLPGEQVIWVNAQRIVSMEEAYGGACLAIDGMVESLHVNEKPEQILELL